MLDLRAMLERQAVWQRKRANMPWETKLRMAVILRHAQRALHQPSKKNKGRELPG